MKTRVITFLSGGFFLLSLVNCAPDSPTYQKNGGLFSKGSTKSVPSCSAGSKKKKTKVATFK